MIEREQTNEWETYYHRKNTMATSEQLEFITLSTILSFFPIETCTTHLSASEVPRVKQKINRYLVDLIYLFCDNGFKLFLHLLFTNVRKYDVFWNKKGDLCEDL